ncbi:L-glyceraldehyde 3-phosphate reductase [Streptomyces sp. V4I8]
MNRRIDRTVLPPQQSLHTQGVPLARELDLLRHPPMVYRRCGFSGLHVSALAVGLPWSTNDKGQAGIHRVLVQRALDLGITHFDVPASWAATTGGSGKQMQGALANLRRHRDDVVLAAHIGFGARRQQSVGFGSRKVLLSSLHAVLRGLSLEYVDILYSDRYDPNTPLEETMGALASAVRQGKALYVGLAGYAPAMARRAVEILSDIGIPPIVCQAPFSVLNPWAEDALLDILDSYRVSFVADNPLASGELDWTVQSDEDKDYGQRPWMPRARSVTNNLSVLAEARNQNLSQLALSWVLHNCRVSSAVITPRTVSQLEDLCAAVGHTSFTAVELETITELLRAGHRPGDGP